MGGGGRARGNAGRGSGAQAEWKVAPPPGKGRPDPGRATSHPHPLQGLQLRDHRALPIPKRARFAVLPGPQRAGPDHEAPGGDLEVRPEPPFSPPRRNLSAACFQTSICEGRSQ